MTYNTVVFLCTRDVKALFFPHLHWWNLTDLDGATLHMLSMQARGEWGWGWAVHALNTTSPRSLHVPALPVPYPTNQGLNSVPVWMGATAPKLMRFCTCLCQPLTQSSSSFFNYYFHCHHLSPSLEKLNLAALPVGQKSSYWLLTLDSWACNTAEVTVNPLAFTFLVFIFLCFYLSLNLFNLLAAFCLPAPFILFVLQKSSPTKFQTTQSEFSYQALQDSWNPLLFYGTGCWSFYTSFLSNL